MSGADLDLVVRAWRAVVAGALRSCSVGVRAGRIAAVAAYDAALAAAEVTDLAADEVLLPGLVDTHVHVNEPGRTEWEGFATWFKCCPPIRGAANRDALWQGLRAGQIDCVVSDHSPCTAELKTGDFADAWGGIASLQLGLAAVWTAARPRDVPLAEVVEWMSARPAALCGLTRKGALAEGRDADMCAFAPEASFVVDAAALRHRNAVSAYDGKRLTGVVRRTWLRGRLVDDEPTGRLLRRAES
jgi:dihydroorotase-like cyclic amidohydrolase